MIASCQRSATSVSPRLLDFMTKSWRSACQASRLRKAGVFSRVDDSGASIGKRYSRNDELGTPYGITVDFASAHKLPSNHPYHFIYHLPSKLCLTVPSLSGSCSCSFVGVCFVAFTEGWILCSERDTTDQRIGKIDEVVDVVIELVGGTLDWHGACRRLPAYDGVQAVD